MLTRVRISHHWVRRDPPTHRGREPLASVTSARLVAAVRTERTLSEGVLVDSATPEGRHTISESGRSTTRDGDTRARAFRHYRRPLKAAKLDEDDGGLVVIGRR
jgi:hypothetical protein